MRDEVGVLIGLIYSVSNFPLLEGWGAFLTGVLHSSSHTPNSMSLQQISMGPTGFPDSWAFLVENIWFGSVDSKVYDHPSRLNSSQLVNTDAWRPFMGSRPPFMMPPSHSGPSDYSRIDKYE
jgi:hypothetical protein